MKIAVLAGGLSPERDVSLSSGSLIANALASRGHRVALIDVYLGVEAENTDSLFTTAANHTHTVPPVEPDLDALKRASGNGDALIGKNVIECCKSADCVFIAMHGGMGENGQLQATLDSFGIKYTGSSYAGCLLSMDKDISKKLMLLAGIPTAKWMLYSVKSDSPEAAEAQIGYPCAIKPCSCGSSIGVSIVRNREEFFAAVKYAAVYEETVMVEKMIVGREFSVGVLGGKVLPPIEIIPKAGFYDYSNKYQSGATEEICPASLTEAQLETISKYTLAVHNTLHLGGYSRTDFILDEAAQDFFCLEANSLPGMTPTSLLPQEAKAVGINYETLCETICRLAAK